MNSLDKQVADAQAQLADLQRRQAYANGALTDSETREMEAAQLRADSAYKGLGLGGAPPRQLGETPVTYKARLAEGLQRYAYDDGLRKMNLRTLANLAPTAFSNFETQVIAEATRRGDDGSWSADGNIREKKVLDAAGRAWTEYAGPSTLSWMDAFMMPRRKVRSYVDSRGALTNQYASLNLK
jgi:hypothetical protein